MVTIDKKSLVIFFVAAALIVFAIATNIGADKVGENEPVNENIDNTVTIIPNQGGRMEGHTPRGFPGTGIGLFVGDNLNPSFPEGDGVQMFLTFDISKVSGANITSAVLRNAENIEVQGTPFKDLGNLIVEAVSYRQFSKDLWNGDSLGKVCILATSKKDAYECDVSPFVRVAVANGEGSVQFRVRFEKAGDGDGMRDMVSFYTTDTNTNEPGIFELEIAIGSVGANREKFGTDKVQSSAEINPTIDIQIPITAYLVTDSAEASTQRNAEDIKGLFEKSDEIWSKAGITLDVSIGELVLSENMVDAVASGNFEALYTVLPPDNRSFTIFYVSDLLGPNGIAIPPRVALVADITTVDDFRATAHEIGHLLGLSHTRESVSRLMFPGANGRELSDDEISRARAGAFR